MATSGTFNFAPDRTFYVYEHWRPDTDQPFYVGKGSGGRANDMRKRSRHHLAIQAKLARLGMCVEVRLMGDALTEPEAHALEIERIAFWRAEGAKLANRTAGGEGMRGHRHPAEVIERIAAQHRGRKRSLETRAKIAAKAKGRVPAAKGKPSPLRGRQLSAETRRRMSEGVKARWARWRPMIESGEWENPLKGYQHSAETRQKMSKSAKKRREHAN